MNIEIDPTELSAERLRFVRAISRKTGVFIDNGNQDTRLLRVLAAYESLSILSAMMEEEARLLGAGPLLIHQCRQRVEKTIGAELGQPQGNIVLAGADEIPPEPKKH